MATPSPVRQCRLLWLVVALAAAGAAVLSPPWRWLAAAESLTLDFRHQLKWVWRGPAETGAVIVGVADSSFALAERAPAEAAREPLAAMTQAWPWDRRVFAEVVRRLRASGAKAIVFDIVFAAETAGDAEFARAIAEPGAPVVLASQVQVERTAVGEATVRHLEPRAPLLAAARGGSGYANVFPDDDGVIRSFTTEMGPEEFLGESSAHGRSGWLSLAQAAARAVRPEMATSPAGLIDFRGPAGTVPVVPIEDLFLPDRWGGSWLGEGRLFRDQIVWVGPLSEIRFKDYHATPFGAMAGVEVQAQALAALLEGRAPRVMSRPAALACMWVLAAVALTLAWRTSRVSRQLVVVAGGAAGWVVLALGSFVFAGVVLPVVAPLGAWCLAGGGGVGAKFIVEQRERRRLRGILDRYVSEEVARIVVEQPEDFSQALKGERRPVTVLFADLRGFTSWVERAEPEAFVAQLNEHFNAVVDCVLSQGGTLQKFIGDAVFAVWGDTRSAGVAEDATRAVSAALAMQEAVTRLNAGWSGRPDRTPMQLGIGLHHGVAMVGNVGHERRMEFAVLGDVVNVAARLESANRQLGTSVLMSAEVRDLVGAAHRCVPLGSFGLKGRSEAVELFVPLGKDAGESGWSAKVEAALAAWRAGDFPAAASAYGELARLCPDLGDFFRRQAERARAHAATPPPEWTGAERLESK